jgi:hypothetical protein
MKEREKKLLPHFISPLSHLSLSLAVSNIFYYIFLFGFIRGERDKMQTEKEEAAEMEIKSRNENPPEKRAGTMAKQFSEMLTRNSISRAKM